MLFNSLDFLIFFPLVTLAYFLLPHRVRWIWLLATSYYFYMCWDPRYALLMLFSTAVTFVSGLLLQRAGQISDGRKRERRRRLWVALSFLINLSVLFFFKYWDFFWNNVEALLALAGLTMRKPVFDVVLPVGISFYTFQALSYTMDVYRGEIPAERNFFRYALFVSFFPQLVAGPIERSKNLIHQVHERHEFRADRARDGLLLMLWGLFQKMVIADRVGILVDQVFDHYQTMPAWALALATVFFAFQIYCDFGGYSNTAIGAAQVLGFSLMENFRQPYLSRSCAEFWRRWHISLSTWFRDYLYIPLGGNRKGKPRKWLNTMITFTASGLWHGANWSYVVWGGLNGLFQVIGDALRPARERLSAALHVDREALPWRLLQMAVTFVLTDFAWLFFRAPSFRTAVDILRSVLSGGVPAGADFSLGLEAPELWAMGISLLVLAAVDLLGEAGIRVRSLVVRCPLPLRWLCYLLAVYTILIFGIYGPGFSAAQFIYFQF
ncbi:MBOAT family protein [Pseudoflavonifractor sp. MSJ-37]|uniref:MBOAT family O-acyltransferase n=1 Tax=Pseudoflavonifractor sp. MSJ-37 TaxID=2841531 RepID=UPI001C116DCF|nr:MBOAT family O-acyltransferase [Pseudoflavonifractor sp. MSJ-37]MBU5435851.1 MBOAT family protein [Pseudoflavonifractor sp. MSJ-37]